MIKAIDIICEFLSKSANVSRDSISEETQIVGSGVFSSLTMVELVMTVERQFDIEIPPEGLTEENFATVSTLAAFVSEMISERQSSTAA